MYLDNVFNSLSDNNVSLLSLLNDENNIFNKSKYSYYSTIFKGDLLGRAFKFSIIHKSLGYLDIGIERINNDLCNTKCILWNSHCITVYISSLQCITSFICYNGMPIKELHKTFVNLNNSSLENSYTLALSLISHFIETGYLIKPFLIHYKEVEDYINNITGYNIDINKIVKELFYSNVSIDDIYIYEKSVHKNFIVKYPCLYSPIGNLMTVADFIYNLSFTSNK